MKKEESQLKDALSAAGLVDLDDQELESVIGGACKAGCMNSCSSCSTCSPGNASGGTILEESP